MPKASGGKAVASAASVRTEKLNTIARDIYESLPPTLKSEVHERMEEMGFHNAQFHEDFGFALDDTFSLVGEWLQDREPGDSAEDQWGVSLQTAKMWVNRSKEAYKLLKERSREV